MPIQKFKNKETGLVWDVSQEDLAERLAADGDFELVVDAPAPQPPVAAADAKAAADADAAKKAQGV